MAQKYQTYAALLVSGIEERLIVMRMNIDFASHVYEIDFIPFLGEGGEEYQKGFENWYYEEVVCQDENGNEIYCLQQRSDLRYDCFDIEVVLDWFKIASPNCGIKVVSCFFDSKNNDKTLPTICF